MLHRGPLLYALVMMLLLKNNKDVLEISFLLLHPQRIVRDLPPSPKDRDGLTPPPPSLSLPIESQKIYPPPPKNREGLTLSSPEKIFKDLPFILHFRRIWHQWEQLKFSLKTSTAIVNKHCTSPVPKDCRQQSCLRLFKHVISLIPWLRADILANNCHENNVGHVAMKINDERLLEYLLTIQ